MTATEMRRVLGSHLVLCWRHYARYLIIDATAWLTATRTSDAENNVTIPLLSKFRTARAQLRLHLERVHINISSLFNPVLRLIFVKQDTIPL